MEWNRREFIVKPIMLAGTAGVLGKTDLLSETCEPTLDR